MIDAYVAQPTKLSTTCILRHFGMNETLGADASCPLARRAKVLYAVSILTEYLAKLNLQHGTSYFAELLHYFSVTSLKVSREQSGIDPAHTVTQVTATDEIPRCDHDLRLCIRSVS